MTVTRDTLVDDLGGHGAHRLTLIVPMMPSTAQGLCHQPLPPFKNLSGAFLLPPLI